MTRIVLREKFLARRPSLRESIMTSAEFQNEISQYPSIEIDNETIILFGGDQQKDIDQVALNWAIEHGLVSKTEVDQARASHE